MEQVAGIMKKVQATADRAVEKMLRGAIDALISHVSDYWKLGHLGVTGNAYNSVTAGLYKGRKLVYANWNGKHVDRPTRATLAKGEAYDLPTYYDGDAVEKPYVGEVGNGGVWGQQLGPWVLYSQRYRSSFSGNDWSVVIAMPVVYAGYHPKLVKTMQAMLDAVPRLVDEHKVRVNTVHQGSLFDASGAPF